MSAVSLDEGNPIRRKIRHHELTQVIPDILLRLKADQILRQFDEGFKELRFADWYCIHVFSTLQSGSVMGSRYRFSKNRVSKSDIRARLIIIVLVRNDANSAACVGDRSKHSQPASAVFPQSSTRSGVGIRQQTDAPGVRYIQMLAEHATDANAPQIRRMHFRLREQRADAHAHRRFCALEHIHIPFGQANERMMLNDKTIFLLRISKATCPC